ncbi:MAG: hypothetical protein ACTJHU_00520, partial [Mycetocola sp.]
DSIVDEVNRTLSRPEQLKRFVLLSEELSEQTGYVTPTMKLRRGQVISDFQNEVDRLYASDAR